MLLITHHNGQYEVWSRDGRGVRLFSSQYFERARIFCGARRYRIDPHTINARPGDEYRAA